MLKEILMRNGLSNREAEVAELVSQGLANKEVADKLYVTEKTVKFHLTNIYKKMNIKSRSQLIVWCLPKLNFIENQRRAQQNENIVLPTAQPAFDRPSSTPAENTSGIGDGFQRGIGNKIG